MDNGVKKLLSFMEKDTDSQKFIPLGMQSYFEEFAEECGLEDIDEIEEFFGDSWMQIYPCALEFFFSNEYIKNYDNEKTDSWNVIDSFLNKRGMMLNGKNKEYLRSLRNSHMSIYEVVDIKFDHSLTVKDLISGGNPIIIREKSLTHYVEKWETMGLRVCKEKGHNIIAGGALKLDRETALELAGNLAEIHKMGLQEIQKGNKDLFDDESPDKVEKLFKAMWAKEIGLAYMLDISKQKNKLQNLYNSDGHKISWCNIEFPLSAAREDVVAVLTKIPDFTMEENTKKRSFWNWLKIEKHKKRNSQMYLKMLC